MKKINKNYILFFAFVVFAIISYLASFDLGIRIWDNFLVFAKDMVLILPPAFILLGIFDVWATHDPVE